jgi:hypothetical protein
MEKKHKTDCLESRSPLPLYLANSVSTHYGAYVTIKYELCQLVFGSFIP